MTDLVWPEDEGTGAAEGDKDDAANFTTGYYATGFTDRVRTGLSITYNSGGPDFDLSAGLAVIQVGTVTADQTGEARDQGNSFVALLDSRSNISLTDNAVNEIYVEIDLSSDDTINVLALTSGTPSNDYIKIGEIDTSADTVDEDFNRTYAFDANVDLQSNELRNVGKFAMDDDADFEFGSVPYTFRYDSGNTQFEFESSDIDGGGTTDNIFRVSDGSHVEWNRNNYDVDFNVGSTGVTKMLHVDASENQLVVHGASDPDYGALFAHGRATGSGADNDVVATLGEDDETVTINSNNTGRINLVQIQTPSLTSTNSVSPNHLSSLWIESAPDSSDVNVNPTETWALEIGAGNVRVGSGGGSTSEICMEKQDTATSSTQQPSNPLMFVASSWDTTNSQEEERSITLQNKAGSGADGSEPYRLAVEDNAGTEFASFDGLNQRLEIGQDNASAGSLGLGFTDGSIPFSNGTQITQDNANLHWDRSNNRLGVRTSSPGFAVDVSTGVGPVRLRDLSDVNANSDAAVHFTGGGSVESGAFTEVDGEILSYAINTQQVASSVSTSRVGGIFRLDTRSAEEKFVVIGKKAADSSLGLSDRLFYIDLEGGNTRIAPNRGDVTVGGGSPNYQLDVNGPISSRALSSDPADPPSNQSVKWQSDGTGSGSDGDIMMKITDSSGTTKTVTLIDFSAN